MGKGCCASNTNALDGTEDLDAKKRRTDKRKVKANNIAELDRQGTSMVDTHSNLSIKDSSKANSSVVD